MPTASYRFSDFHLVPSRRSLYRDSKPVDLKPKTLDVLLTLVERHHRAVPQSELYEVVWPAVHIGQQNIRTHIYDLRRVLGHKSISTIPGVGYKFALDVTAEGKQQPAEVPHALPNRPKTNLRQSLTPTVGRETETRELGEEIAVSRLVTLSGTSGIGKTTLAVELGHNVLHDFPDGVWLVDLSPISNPTLVIGAVARVLDIRLQTEESSLDHVVSNIGSRQLLLIFDNCEHLLDATRLVVLSILQRTPNSKILITSQEPLGVLSEQTFRIMPLAIPPANSDEVMSFGAVALFVERARAAHRNFSLNAENVSDVLEICRRLDGIPLAIEMAAARLPLLGTRGLASSLPDRFALLKNSAPAAITRHQTLQDMVEWSYSLLAPTDQRVLRRLSVFASTFSIEAASAVGGAEGRPTFEVIDSLDRLVGKSLIIADDGQYKRYRLLETIRLYAASLLQAEGGQEQAAESMAWYFVELFRRGEVAWEQTPDDDWFAEFVPEVDNIRAVLQWAARPGDRTDVIMRLVGTTARLWDRVGLLAEGRSYIDQAIALIRESTPSEVGGRILAHAGLLWHHSDRPRALHLLERAVSFYSRTEQKEGLPFVLCTIGGILAVNGDVEGSSEALSSAEETLAVFDLPKSTCILRINQGIWASVKGDQAAALTYFSAAFELCRSPINASRRGFASLNLAELELELGEIDQATVHGREAVTSFRSAARLAPLAMAIINLSVYLTEQGNIEEARATAMEALTLARSEGGHTLRTTLQQIARLQALEGSYDSAAQLAGYVDEIERAQREPNDQNVYDSLVKILQSRMDEERRTLLFSIGKRLTSVEAIRLATGGRESP